MSYSSENKQHDLPTKECLTLAKSSDAGPDGTWDHLPSRFDIGADTNYSRHAFVSHVVETVIQSGAVYIKGGVIRDQLLNQVLKKRAVNGKSVRCVTPDDIDCSPLAGVTYPLTLLLDALHHEFGEANVTLFPVESCNDYSHLAMWLRCIHVRQAGGNDDVTIDYSVPFRCKHQQVNPERFSDVHDALDMDVNGLELTKSNSDGYDAVRLHRVLQERNISYNKIKATIAKKMFTVVANDRMLHSTILWSRVLKRVRNGWIGVFALGPDLPTRKWRFDSRAQKLVSSCGIRVSITRMDGSANSTFAVWMAKAWSKGEAQLEHDGAHKQKAVLCCDEPPFQIKPRDAAAVSNTLPSCCVCLDKTANNIVLPCMHLCLCTDCSKDVQQQPNMRCPVCRSSSNMSVKRVFFS
jgi:hypothetical protein